MSEPPLPVVGSTGWGDTLNAWGADLRADLGSAQAAAAAAQAGVDDLNAAGLLKGVAGRKYKLVAGVIRNTGSGWALISDASHRNVGITGVSQSSTAITITYDTALRVVSVIAIPDETYAAQGLEAGTSVGLSSTVIQCYRPGDGLGDYVHHNGTTWVSFSGVFGISGYASGILSLTHPSVGETANPRGSVTKRRKGTTVYNYGLASMDQTTTQVQVLDSAGALAGAAGVDMGCWVERAGHVARAPIDPATLADASGNLWIIGVLEMA